MTRMNLLILVKRWIFQSLLLFVMQQVGSALGIDPATMTKEQLEAVPKKVAPNSNKNV
jgi:hypothetical protein